MKQGTAAAWRQRLLSGGLIVIGLAAGAALGILLAIFLAGDNDWGLSLDERRDNEGYRRVRMALRPGRGS